MGQQLQEAVTLNGAPVDIAPLPIDPVPPKAEWETLRQGVPLWIAVRIPCAAGP